MNVNLAQALNALGINDVTLRNEKGEKIELISAKKHAEALFSYLNMAEYLNDSILQKAVDYLAAAKPFPRDKETVLNDLRAVCKLSNENGKFDAEYFITHFGKEDYFSFADIIDLIVFLQQTAFARPVGVERDRLALKPWMKEHREEFIVHATRLGVVTPLPPLHDQYPALGIMGAASSRVTARLEYFRKLKIACHSVWALSGNRELSKGLDTEEVMAQVAAKVKKPVKFIEKQVGVDKRIFLDGVTETMMVNYLIETICPDKKINVVDSAVEFGHWRATSKQSAADIAPIIIDRILSEKTEKIKEVYYHFLIIAEQPYASRMAKQVQREFTKVITERGLEKEIYIEVEGCGPGISESDLLNDAILTRLDSELGSLMAERFNDYRYLQQSNKELRNPDIIMFAKRVATYDAYLAQAKENEKALCLPKV
jgi:hypothetical protein